MDFAGLNVKAHNQVFFGHILTAKYNVAYNHTTSFYLDFIMTNLDISGILKSPQ